MKGTTHMIEDTELKDKAMLVLSDALFAPKKAITIELIIGGFLVAAGYGKLIDAPNKSAERFSRYGVRPVPHLFCTASGLVALKEWRTAKGQAIPAVWDKSTHNLRD
jgi:hypothetical protein